MCFLRFPRFLCLSLSPQFVILRFEYRRASNANRHATKSLWSRVTRSARTSLICGSSRCLRRARCFGIWSTPLPPHAMPTLQSILPLHREWILTKVVNGERASYSAPKFARMQERTRSQMLEDIVANLANHAETGQIPKPYRRGSWRPIGEDPCMLRVMTLGGCMRLISVPHSM